MKKKIKAGALQLTIFIVVVIALLLSGFILLVHTQNLFKFSHKETLETINNSNQGIDYALHNDLPLNDSIIINTSNSKSESIHIQTEYWGVFKKVKSSSKINHKNFQKIALIGGKQHLKNRASLYVANHNKPLIVVGKTYIKGVAFLPEQGVRPGNIAGKSFYNSQLVYGPISRNQENLPSLSTELKPHLQNIMGYYKKFPQEYYIPLGKNEMQNSFHNKPRIIYQTSPIDLEFIELKGQIVVQSDTKLIVYPSAKLKDVILIAPEIEIKNGVKGRFQAIATKKIIVGEEVKLTYPSALVINEKRDKKELTAGFNRKPTVAYQLKINKNSQINGLVIYQGGYDPNNYEAQIYVEEKSTIKGELYGTSNVELKGNVFGTVYAANFVAHQYSSIYQNHLYNATIDISRLPQEYIGIQLEKGKDKEVMQWLY